MRSYEIRRLIENYYDIQKIRVETFNRIVCWVRENKERLKDALKSHFLNEPQEKIASQFLNETQGKVASQLYKETQRKNASQYVHETHSLIALELLEKKKYSEFVKKFILNHKTREPPPSSAFSNLLKEIKDLIWFHNRLYETEKELYRRIDKWSKDHPLRKEFLSKVRGIGPILASGIIAWLSEPILKANYVSQLWSYCGLAPGQKRKRGQKANFDPRLKSFVVYRIGQSFIKFKCFGRKLYDAFRKQCEEKHKDWSKLHCHNWARRKVVKLFLASVWEVWRRMNGLPVTEPYPIEILGHKDKITPEMWIEKGEVKVIEYKIQK